MATFHRVFVLNAPTIAGDASAVSWQLYDYNDNLLASGSGAGLGGVVALTAGYQVTADYNSTWPTHGYFVWLYSSSEVARETFDVASAKEMADAFMLRSIATRADGGRTVQDALRACRNKVAFDVPSAGMFTVYK